MHRAFETFGVNKHHDLIQSVAGLPGDDVFGKRFEGSDAFTLATYVDFDDLGAKCDALYALWSQRSTDCCRRSSAHPSSFPPTLR